MKHAAKIVMVSLVTLMGAACTASREAASSTNEVAATSATPASDQQPAVIAASADGAILDACALVSQADADGILGVPAKLSPHLNDDDRESHCAYNAVNEGSGINELTVEIHSYKDANEARTSFATNQTMYEGAYSGADGRYEGLTGIGDDAFLVTSDQTKALAQGRPVADQPQKLYLIKGAKYVVLTTNDAGKPRATDSVKALAKKLADHF